MQFMHLFFFHHTIKVAEEGARGLAKGWAPTAYGYSAQVSALFT